MRTAGFESESITAFDYSLSTPKAEIGLLWLTPVHYQSVSNGHPLSEQLAINFNTGIVTDIQEAISQYKLIGRPATIFFRFYNHLTFGSSGDLPTAT